MNKEKLVLRCRELFEKHKDFYLEQGMDYAQEVQLYSRLLDKYFPTILTGYTARITVSFVGDILRQVVGRKTYNLYPLLEAFVMHGFEPKKIRGIADGFFVNVSAKELKKLSNTLWPQIKPEIVNT